MTNPTQLIKQLVRALETAKNWHQGDKWRNGNFQQQETWAAFHRELEAALTAARSHLEQPTEAHAAMDAQGDADEYQYRTKPTWDANAQWSNWTKCNRGSFEDYKRTPVHNDWIYEARALYTRPQPTGPLQWCEKCGEGVTDFCRGKRGPCEYGFERPGQAAEPAPSTAGEAVAEPQYRIVVNALSNLLAQVEKFCTENGEADFYTGEALKALESVCTYEHAQRAAILQSTALPVGELTDEDCTRIYNEANGITTKNPPLTTARIFCAMRAAARPQPVLEPKCQHVNGKPSYDYWQCTDCGMIKPDGDSTGRPNGGWFHSMEAFSAWKKGITQGGKV